MCSRYRNLQNIGDATPGRGKHHDLRLGFQILENRRKVVAGKKCVHLHDFHARQALVSRANTVVQEIELFHVPRPRLRVHQFQGVVPDAIA